MYIQVGMTDKDIIDRLQEYWGGFVSKRDYKEQPWKPLWTWTLTPKNGAVELTEAILPYLGRRRTIKATECLEHARGNPRGEKRKKARDRVAVLTAEGLGPSYIASTLGISRAYVQILKRESLALNQDCATIEA